MQKICVDLVEMPEGINGFKYFISARDDLTGYIDGEALKTKCSSKVARFYLDICVDMGLSATLSQTTVNLAVKLSGI